MNHDVELLLECQMILHVDSELFDSKALFLTLPSVVLYPCLSVSPAREAKVLYHGIELL